MRTDVQKPISAYWDGGEWDNGRGGCRDAEENLEGIAGKQEIFLNYKALAAMDTLLTEGPF